MKHIVYLRDVIKALDGEFHPELQEDYDNSGYLFGDGNTPYHGALVALDLTESVVEEAVAQGLNLIVTHHPFIFSGVKRLTEHSATGRMVLRLAQEKIAVYAAHTNLDNLPWGVNAALAEHLKLSNLQILKPLDGHHDCGAGMVGELSAAEECDAYLQQVKSALGLPTLRCSAHDSRKPVRRVAFCGGSGSEFIHDALIAKADLYLTADLKYHDFQRTDGRMVLCDVGHYESEQFAKDIIFRVVLRNFSNFAVRYSESQGSIVCYI